MAGFKAVPKSGPKPKKPRKQIPKVSKKKTKIEREHAAVKKLLLASRGPQCQMRTPVCTGWAKDAHEKLARSQGGDPTDPDEILLGCCACHGWIDQNHAEAIKRGLKRSRLIPLQPVNRLRGRIA